MESLDQEEKKDSSKEDIEHEPGKLQIFVCDIHIFISKIPMKIYIYFFTRE